MTVERGLNGTTAATHDDAKAISKYEPEFNIVTWCRREAIMVLLQEKAGWARELGSSDAAQEFKGVDIKKRREMDIDSYSPMRIAAI